MFRVFACLAVEHDWRLVLLAGLVCLLASSVAVSIFHRAIVAPARTRLIWIGIAGAAIGYGIWATHFVAMLAYEPGVTTGYGIVLTALSLATAMLLTSGGFGIAARLFRPVARRGRRCRHWRRHRQHALSRNVGT
ncbi:NO-binding membrane sensor protein with MHYT domain [Bradyrhizobium sp. GM6.1]